MRLENVTSEQLEEMPDHDLLNMRERANQMWSSVEVYKEHIAKGQIGISQPIPEGSFMDIYSSICEQVEKRGLRPTHSSLDKRLLKKSVRMIDVGEFPAIVLRENAAVVSGKFVTNPRKADRINVYLDPQVFSNDWLDEQIEKRLGELLVTKTGQSVETTKEADGLVAPVIPLFDLVLMPRADTEELDSIEGIKKARGSFVSNDNEEVGAIVIDKEDALGDSLEVRMTDISKPFPNEHAASQLPPGQFDTMKRENNKLAPGVHVIWGIKGNKSKIQSIRFSASKFTADEAKKWLAGHDFKTTLEVAAKKASFIKNNEQQIVGGIVYEVGCEDSQGDRVDDKFEIWKAMESWAINNHTVKMMHDGRPIDCPVIESFQAEVDTEKGGGVIPAGAWYICVKILNDGIWRSIKDGSISGFSMAGTASSEEIND